MDLLVVSSFISQYSVFSLVQTMWFLQAFVSKYGEQVWARSDQWKPPVISLLWLQQFGWRLLDYTCVIIFPFLNLSSFGNHYQRRIFGIPIAPVSNNNSHPSINLQIFSENKLRFHVRKMSFLGAMTYWLRIHQFGWNWIVFSHLILNVFQLLCLSSLFIYLFIL